MPSFIQFKQKYATPEACLDYLKKLRWADGAYCPHCGSNDKIYHYSDHRRHKCGLCKKVFTITTGTIFSNSPVKMLPKWFAAIWLDTRHNKGISSLQLSKDIGVAQKTAWYMLKRIRHAASQGRGDMSGGDIESDETCMGAQERNKQTKKGGKTNPVGSDTRVRGSNKKPAHRLIAF